MAASTVFSTNLQKLRKEKGVTQEQLANHLGVSPQAVSKWENGSYPEGDLLPRISDFFGVSISYLYGQESRDNSIEQTVLNRLSEIYEKHLEEGKPDYCNPEYFQQAMDIVWAFQLGFWKHNKDYWQRGQYSKDAKQASCIIDDAGFGYLNLNREQEFYTLVREPEDGYAANLPVDEETREYFTLLGKPGTLEILLFLLSLNQAEFVTTETIAKNIELPVELVAERIAEMGKFISGKGNPVFNKIDILESNGPQSAYGINMSCVMNYISLFLLVDTIINPADGYSMQVCKRWKRLLDRDEVLKKIKKLNRKK